MKSNIFVYLKNIPKYKIKKKLFNIFLLFINTQRNVKRKYV